MPQRAHGLWLYATTLVFAVLMVVAFLAGPKGLRGNLNVFVVVVAALGASMLAMAIVEAVVMRRRGTALVRLLNAIGLLGIAFGLVGVDAIRTIVLFLGLLLTVLSALWGARESRRPDRLR